MIKAVLFDLDGTLFDSSPGIFHSANYTMRALGFPECHDEKQLRKFVGPPLRECFRITYGTEEKYLDRCVEVYREEYKRVGMHLCYLYKGIKELLIALRSRGIKTGVCTLKYEVLAKAIFDEKGISDLFDVIRGTNDTGTITKSDCIVSAIKALKLKSDEVLMVGHTINDENGALTANVQFAGVTWGFGFEKKEDITSGFAVDNPKEILNIVFKGEEKMDISKISTAEAPAAIGPYSQAVVANGMIFCSGQIPIDPATGSIHGESAPEQATQCFKNIKAVLKAAGTSIDRVIKATVFLADMNDFASVNEVYAKAFEGAAVLPARSAVQVARLPKDVKVEIEVIALL